MSNKLLTTIYQNETDLLEQVKELVKKGADVNYITEYAESALRVASNNGRLKVIRFLLDSGADASQLKWSRTFFEVAFGDIKSIQASLKKQKDIDQRDTWERTPWLLAVQLGNIEKASFLLKSGASKDVVGRVGKIPMGYAIQHDNVEMLTWLIEQGLDIETRDHYLDTPVIIAAKEGAIRCLKYLLDLGADIYKENHIPERAIQATNNINVARMLIDSGDDINDMSEGVHAQLLGIEYGSAPNITKADYLAGKDRVFGNKNPQKIKNKFWLEMIKSGAGAWQAQDLINKTYKEEDSPVWCYQRFGRTTNILDDGRIIDIAGEHEDSYDPDFCIYNDIVVFHPDGEIDIYIYPEKVFPPTDFHTATLVDDWIYIIGSLGYFEKRKPDLSPVYRLNIHSFEIEQVDTSGEMPNWISRHKAYYDGTSRIKVEGGQIYTDKGLLENNKSFELCLKTKKWRKF